MTIAVGVAAGVIAMGFIVLLGAGPFLRRPATSENICLLDRVLVFERSAVGQSANSQLLQIKRRYQDEINAEKAAIDQTGLAGTPSGRMSELVRRAQTENALLLTVRNRARNLVIQKIAPEIKKQAAISRCATVLDRSTVVRSGPGQRHHIRTGQEYRQECAAAAFGHFGNLDPLTLCNPLRESAKRRPFKTSGVPTASNCGASSHRKGITAQALRSWWRSRPAAAPPPGSGHLAESSHPTATHPSPCRYTKAGRNGW